MTTNNIMELTAARAALQHVLETVGDGLKGAQITLRLDSEYVLKGMRDWLPGWKRKGWRTGKGQEVKNKDIWIAIDAIARKLDGHAKINFVHVRGHSGDPENDRVDEIAVEARDLSRRGGSDWAAAPRLMSEPDNAPSGP
jgi:ribonuclease HI